MTTNGLTVRPVVFRNRSGDVGASRGAQFARVAFLALVVCSVANHCLAHWLGLSRSAPWKSAALYRRIGPETGPQAFCAGSSLLVYGLSWPDVSGSLGLGLEDWTVAGSSPEVWEVFRQRANPKTVIVGVSVYDLNEMRLTPDRARYVPLTQTITDLWNSGADSGLRHRILMQYAFMYVRLLYPMAGDSDKVLEAIRRKAAEQLGMQARLDAHEGVLVEQAGVLNVQDSMMMPLSDWPSARVVRRTAALREENHSSHRFLNGPKNRAFQRLLLQAQQRGRVIVVVLPVSQAYADAFLDKAAVDAFEREISDAMAIAPEATLVRLDRVPGISRNEYFEDLVHLNLSGRQLLTPVFLKEVRDQASKRN